jgi:predicted PurR-regulated permease PerM
MAGEALSVRVVVRTVLVVVGVLFCLYLVYRLRKPITWIVIAGFLAVALSPAVDLLDRYMRRGFAIAIVYLSLFATVIVLALLLIPPIVREVNDLADNAPHYVQDVRDYVEKNRTLRKLNKDYEITDKLQQEAEKLPSKVGDAAGILKDIGFGIVNSIFALITILVLTAFMLGSGPRWRQAFLDSQPPNQRERLDRLLSRISSAVASYVIGAFTVSLIDGVAAFVVLTILGVPFAAPLGITMGFMSLIPLVGATIGAVIVGIVTAFHNFPTTTIIWTIYAIVYQQFENSVIQPQVQRRTVRVHPFVVLVSVLFGATLLGVLGALIAIPVAATIDISIQEYRQYRRDAQLLPPEAAES